jgi:hypothetical protein
MLSGRNHHAVGMGGITGIATSAPATTPAHHELSAEVKVDILRVMVDITEATFEDLAAHHEVRATLAMATQ